MSKSAKKKQGKQSRKLRAPRWLKAIGRVLRTVLIIFWPLRPLGRYIKGAWEELRQVKWPTHKTTTKLTLAVIAFTAVLTVFIVALDYVFELVVKRILL